VKVKKKILCFDLDGVICTTLKNNYKSSKPKIKAIKKINNLYSSGYYIKIFTARYMGRSNENRKEAQRRGQKLTKKQLKSWKVNYHKLILGKPSYDLFIDDKSIFYSNNWVKKINKFLK
jgi:histidinol phosphatase-like enzyme|tara:strand:- start:1 stop:357 length:357 start_codon:yes stop_codon:yes gene_type:complete